MKKLSEKKLSLGKIKVAGLSKSTKNELAGSFACDSFRICTNNMSQGAPICSVDSCRF
ncbi:hypothetical protein CLV51_102855 [Chitinophaga niastensis]|uniref:Uncharacterized protein n=1 Tax=Chitinophaga niastensis TaxID=536980 RepID=A0A2P8HP60_CHINA|nr:hypothetical protein [Chitinophaga niastensis]PSL47995.1 hypothetical protein CLV51_102855 [Chitinophaga niastensis]